MRFQSYFNTAVKIIQLYDGLIPLHYFLKQYFSQHKKHGSKDRKFITHLCYNFFRLGKSFNDLATEEKLKIAIFICNETIDEWSFLYDADWLNYQNNLLDKRIAFVQEKYSLFSLNEVFPFTDELSEILNTSAFIKSFFVQPDVFIRIRPGYQQNVISKLKQHNISFNYVDEDAVVLSPSVNINSIIIVDEEAVIQDYSSQKIKEFLQIIESEMQDQKSEIKIWDCCAGSGGKSILAYDVFKKINLTVTDVRASIIENLKRRFIKARIKKYKSFVADVTNSKLPVTNSTHDLIICDAPCTGSGTWSRTPEQLFFLQPAKIKAYALLQRKIISNVIPYLKSNGYFLYITCSVFKEENENVVNFIQQKFNLELTKAELLKGYHQRADTLFAALFKKQ